jgi:hypothetical protein
MRRMTRTTTTLLAILGFAAQAAAQGIPSASVSFVTERRGPAR